MLSAKRDRWRMRVAVVGVLALGLLTVAVVMLMSTDVQAQVSTLAVQSVPMVRPTPTVDATATVATLNTEKLVHENDWWWNYGATVLTSVISTITLAAAGIFAVMRYFNDRRDGREKQEAEEKRQREDRQAEVVKRAEERFQSAVAGLGDEKEGAQIGAAILLRTFLRPGYEQFYTQTFDLAVANLRRRGASKIVQRQLWDDPQNSHTALALPLTTLDQALIIVFKEAFPLARDQEKREPASLDATGVQLDNAYLVKADLKRIWGPQASLRKADLSGANLSGADLSEADLSEADLEGANLFGAILGAAILTRAYLWGADLSGADLSEADLRRAEGLTKEQRDEYKARGAWVDEEPASNVSQEPVSTSPPLEPESIQSTSPQETLSTPDVSQSNGTSSQAAPDKGSPGEAEKGGDVGRTPEKHRERDDRPPGK